MAVSKKGLRKITRNGQVFYWCVRNDEDDCDRLYLVIQSESKEFSIRYRLAQENQEVACSQINPHIIVTGKTFKGLDYLGHGWKRFLVPHWHEGAAITPSFVAVVIDWCFAVEDVTKVNYKGEIVSSRRTL